LYELEDAEPPLTWRIDPLPAGDEELASLARERLLSVTPLPLPTGTATVYDHLNTWIAALEAAGAMVADVVDAVLSNWRIPTADTHTVTLRHGDTPLIKVYDVRTPRCTRISGPGMSWLPAPRSRRSPLSGPSAGDQVRVGLARPLVIQDVKIRDLSTHSVMSS
jgi:hypothetical protein